MGTSLVVQPFASLITQVPESTPRILINKTPAGEFELRHQDKDNMRYIVHILRQNAIEYGVKYKCFKGMCIGLAIAMKAYSS
jgi:hypothetical protein